MIKETQLNNSTHINAMNKELFYCTLLNLPRDYTTQELKFSFREISRKNHADVCTQPSLIRRVYYDLVTEAYDYLRLTKIQHLSDANYKSNLEDSNRLSLEDCELHEKNILNKLNFCERILSEDEKINNSEILKKDFLRTELRAYINSIITDNRSELKTRKLEALNAHDALTKSETNVIPKSNVNVDFNKDLDVKENYNKDLDVKDKVTLDLKTTKENFIKTIQELKKVPNTCYFRIKLPFFEVLNSLNKNNFYRKTVNYYYPYIKKKEFLCPLCAHLKFNVNYCQKCKNEGVYYENTQDLLPDTVTFDLSPIDLLNGYKIVPMKGAKLESERGKLILELNFESKNKDEILLKNNAFIIKKFLHYKDLKSPNDNSPYYIFLDQIPDPVVIKKDELKQIPFLKELTYTLNIFKTKGLSNENIKPYFRVFLNLNLVF